MVDDTALSSLISIRPKIMLYGDDALTTVNFIIILRQRPSLTNATSYFTFPTGINCSPKKPTSSVWVGVKRALTDVGPLCMAFGGLRPYPLRLFYCWSLLYCSPPRHRRNFVDPFSHGWLDTPTHKKQTRVSLSPGVTPGLSSGVRMSGCPFKMPGQRVSPSKMPGQRVSRDVRPQSLGWDPYLQDRDLTSVVF
ncbi:hypothetical protein Tco_1394922 [Tanacetum coccineum]